MRTVRLIFLFLTVVYCTFSGAFIHGSTSCPSSGNKSVGTATNLYQLTVYAPSTNAGIVYLGGSSVTTSNGIPFGAGTNYNSGPESHAGLSASSLFFACANSGDKVLWIGVQ